MECVELQGDTLRKSHFLNSKTFFLTRLNYYERQLITQPRLIGLLWIQVGLAAIAGFALRGIYFALLEEGNIPRYLTGTVVGVVSFIGFMPDSFAHLLVGWFVDTYPAGLGHQYYFLFLSGIVVLGLIATLGIRRPA